MTILNFTRAERAAWQRRAVTELATILDRHRELPLLAWTVGPAGSVLLGQIATPTGRDGFDACVEVCGIRAIFVSNSHAFDRTHNYRTK